MGETAIDTIDCRLKAVLRFMPAPVGIVTSYDPDDGTPVGLAMSAFMPVSLDPCALAICVNRTGSSHDALLRAGRFCVNLLHGGQVDHLYPFAGSAGRSARFGHEAWNQFDRIWYIDDAPASIFCNVRERLSFGTHDILVGEVFDLIASGNNDILGWANGALGRLVSLRDGAVRS